MYFSSQLWIQLSLFFYICCNNTAVVGWNPRRSKISAALPKREKAFFYSYSNKGGLLSLSNMAWDIFQRVCLTLRERCNPFKLKNCRFSRKIYTFTTCYLSGEGRNIAHPSSQPTAKRSLSPVNIDRATFDPNRDLITSFWMTRMDQRPLILNATSGSWEGPHPLSALLG